MKESVINYVLEFIKENYSLYFDELIDANYHMNIIDFLEKEKYRGNDICNGKVDNIIQDMIENYISKNLKYVKNQYDTVYSDVKRMILAKDNFLSNAINDDILDVLVDRITNNIISMRGKKRGREKETIL